MQSSVNIKRFYLDNRYGQIHARLAKPSAEEDIKHPPLICFHQSPQSGKVFAEVLTSLGTDRQVYAPDTPGFGESDPPLEPPNIEDYASAMEDLIDQLELTHFDILGYHTGALTGTEIAVRRPKQVRRMVLIGLPILIQEEIDAFFEQPWPIPMEEDGSHITKEWERSVRAFSDQFGLYPEFVK